MARTRYSFWNLGTIQPIAFSACRCQPTHHHVLVDWFGDLLGVRTPSIALWNWSMRKTSKMCMWNLHQPSKNSGHGPTVASSSLFCSVLKASSKLQQINTIKDRLPVRCTLRNWAFSAATVHTNPIYDITLCGLVCTLYWAGWVQDLCGEKRTDGSANGGPSVKAHYIKLLLPPCLLDGIVCTHLGLFDGCH